ERLAALVSLKQLRSVFLSGVRLTPAQCEVLIREMPNLTSMNLTNNSSLDDSIVKSLSGMPTLRILQLQGTKLTAAGVAAALLALWIRARYCQRDPR
ncbi:MAG: hypothetical protein K2Q23_02965, partial [Bryobacteraceae bacterium]|nr:hypothetical protein [Bryobacteraceae bacterium]